MSQCLQQVPLIDASFAAGEISYTKVRAVTGVATPEKEDFLLTIARYATSSNTFPRKSLTSFCALRPRS